MGASHFGNGDYSNAGIGVLYGFGEGYLTVGAPEAGKIFSPERNASKANPVDNSINPELAKRFELYKAWKVENGIGKVTPSTFADFKDPSKVWSNIKEGGNPYGVGGKFFGERALTRERYVELMSMYRGKGPQLQSQLDDIIANQDFVYRSMPAYMLGFYRTDGRISRETYMTTESLGLDPNELMDRAQVFKHWGEHEVLLKIPTNELIDPRVVRPLGESLSTGWEPLTEFYPGAGSGGIIQFKATTKSWNEGWVIKLNNGN